MILPQVRFAGFGQDPACRVRIDRVFRGFFGLQLMAGGSLVFRRNDEPLKRMSEPCFFWTDRTSHYRYGPGSTGSWNHSWIGLSGSTMDNHYRLLLEQIAPDGLVPVGNAEEMISALRALCEALMHPAESLEPLHRLNSLLALASLGQRRPPSKRDGLARIKAVVDASPATDHDFPALARREGMSYSSFRRTFRQRYHQAPGRYLRELRLSRAARLIASTEDRVSGIAYSLGFADPAFFSRLFKSRYGCSPRMFRRNAHTFRGSN